MSRILHQKKMFFFCEEILTPSGGKMNFLPREKIALFLRNFKGQNHAYLRVAYFVYLFVLYADLLPYIE